MDEFSIVGCTGKEAFTDRHLAKRAADRRPGRVIYRCETCGLWHVANTTHRRRKMHKQGHRSFQVPTRVR